MNNFVPLRYDTEAINRDIPITAVLEQYAHSDVHRRDKMITCPSVTHNDEHPSAKIYEHTNTCYCFSCNKNFTPISLAKEYYPELTFPQLCKQLIDDFGLDEERYSNIREVREARNMSQRHEYADIFPLTPNELESIYLDGKTSYEFRRAWIDEGYREFVEDELLRRCDQIQGYVKGEIRNHMREYEDIENRWNSHTPAEQAEIKKLYDTIMEHPENYINGKLDEVLNKEQLEDVEMMASRNWKTGVMDAISDYQQELVDIDKVREKIQAHQAMREKNSSKPKSISADVFPLKRNEFSMIGIHEPPKNEINRAYFYTYKLSDLTHSAEEKNGLKIPSLTEEWAKNKANTEKWIVGKCEETIENIKEEIQVQKELVSKWHEYAGQDKLSKAYELADKHISNLENKIFCAQNIRQKIEARSNQRVNEKAKPVKKSKTSYERE